MDHTARAAVKFLLKAKLAEVYGNAFQDFFHDLMCLRYNDFLDIRTAGRLGDMSSDGLALVGRKLYSCYGPETVDPGNAIGKIRDDLLKAQKKRAGQFDTFVFVHSDRRGMHPVVSAELARLSALHPDVKFENFGYRKLRDEACKLEQAEVEDLLGQPLPVQEVRYRVELEEIAPLLAHLRRSTQTQRPDEHISTVSQEKLTFNAFGDDTQDELRRAIIRSNVIDEYYSDGYRVTERDEVAAAFRAEFDRIRVLVPDAHPDELLYQMELFLLGNLSSRIPERRAALVVLGYFFESCDLFDDVSAEGASSTSGTGRQ